MVDSAIEPENQRGATMARLFGAALGALLILWQPALAQAPVTDLPMSDPAMKAAVARAQARLPEFWRVFASPSAHEQNFSVYVPLRQDGAEEHVWLIQLKRGAGQISGIVASQPKQQVTVKYGDRVAVAEDDIADWSFSRYGKIVGNETLRELVRRLPPKQAKGWAELLAAQ